MKISKIQDNKSNSMAFCAKVSPHFIQTAHNSYNYGNVSNKKNLIWKFNKKVEDYGTFGHDDYVLDYEKKLENGNWEHYLTAQKTDGTGKFIIFQRKTLAKIIDRFMQMNKHEFNTKFKK